MVMVIKNVKFGNDLDRLAYFYRTDKCPQTGHGYTPFYYELLKDKRDSIRKVLEVGIGYPRKMRHVKNYQIGASLYMWREFFPNAQIYGVDIEPTTIFQEERIKTFLFDVTKKDNLINLISQTGADIDLFVDDGDHNVYQQALLCQNVMPLLNKDVIYVIEDVRRVDLLKKELHDFRLEILKSGTEESDSNLVIVKNN